MKKLYVVTCAMKLATKKDNAKAQFLEVVGIRADLHGNQRLGHKTNLVNPFAPQKYSSFLQKTQFVSFYKLVLLPISPKS